MEEHCGELRIPGVIPSSSGAYWCYRYVCMRHNSALFYSDYMDFKGIQVKMATIPIHSITPVKLAAMNVIFACLINSICHYLCLSEHFDKHLQH